MLFAVHSATLLHEFHVSKTEAHYKSEQSDLQVSVHIFIDDLELALKDFSDEPIHLLTQKELPQADSLIYGYLSSKIQFLADDKHLNLSYLGKEISNDFQGVWCYLECNNVMKPKLTSIKNNLLCELYDDQKNIVSLKVDNKTKAFHILDKDDQEMKAELD